MVKKTIYLSDENKIIWEELFGKEGHSASAWVARKLKEELENRLDPEFLRSKLSLIEREKKNLEKEEEIIKEKIEEAERLVKNKKNEKTPKDVKEPNYSHKVKIFSEKLMTVFGFDKKNALDIADEYLSIDPKNRIDEISFINQKRKELDK